MVPSSPTEQFWQVSKHARWFSNEPLLFRYSYKSLYNKEHLGSLLFPTCVFSHVYIWGREPFAEWTRVSAWDRILLYVLLLGDLFRVPWTPGTDEVGEQFTCQAIWDSYARILSHRICYPRYPEELQGHSRTKPNRNQSTGTPLRSSANEKLAAYRQLVHFLGIHDVKVTVIMI